MAIGATQLVDIMDAMAQVLHENKQYLSELDAAIGDGDHGVNMDKGFGHVKEKLAAEPESVEAVLKTTAMTLISQVGGASGPLYGTLFLKASAAVKGEQSIGLDTFCALLDAGVAGVKTRGKSEKGEKTMLDVLVPSLDALTQSVQQGATPEQAMDAMMQAADAGVQYTKTIPATKGRASYLGERSIGHIDPGAMSSYLMLKVIADYVCGR